MNDIVELQYTVNRFKNEQHIICSLNYSELDEEMAKDQLIYKALGNIREHLINNEECFIIDTLPDGHKVMRCVITLNLIKK